MKVLIARVEEQDVTLRQEAIAMVENVNAKRSRLVVHYGTVTSSILQQSYLQRFRWTLRRPL